jgi:hypothetical protein
MRWSDALGRWCRCCASARLRKVPDANITALRQAGLLGAVAPLWRLRMSLRTHIDVVAELGRGCPSTAWCAGISTHSWLMGLFPEAAQRDSFGTDPDAIVSGHRAPRQGSRVDGFVLRLLALRLGCEHSQWIFLALSSRIPAKTVEEGDCLWDGQVTVRTTG